MIEYTHISWVLLNRKTSAIQKTPMGQPMHFSSRAAARRYVADYENDLPEFRGTLRVRRAVTIVAES